MAVMFVCFFTASYFKRLSLLSILEAVWYKVILNDGYVCFFTASYSDDFLISYTPYSLVQGKKKPALRGAAPSPPSLPVLGLLRLLTSLPLLLSAYYYTSQFMYILNGVYSKFQKQL